jgi:hypothetical protein
MHAQSARFALIFVLAAFAAGCNDKPPAATSAAAPAAAPAAPAATSPDATVLASVRALRNNNVAGLLENALPPDELKKMKADWSKEMNEEPVTEEQRKHFAETMQNLTAPGAEDKLYAEAEPQIKQFEKEGAAQMPMMIAMGQGFIQSAIQQNKDLTEAQKAETVSLVDAMAKWAQSAKFTDPAMAKQAIAAVCKTARDLNLQTIDQARALTYEQAMQKAGIVVAGFKRVLEVYGLSMDKALDSVKAETVSTAADTAKVKVSYVAFDKPFTTESDLVRLDGKWYSKQAVDQWKKLQAREAQIASGGDDDHAAAPAAK